MDDGRSGLIVSENMLFLVLLVDVRKAFFEVVRVGYEELIVL